MGLMGVWITSFRPKDTVTRAEFWTVLSRALWDEKYNNRNPFYTNHLKALKEKGIMSIIDKPETKEIRGYVMLMMKRIYNKK
jgi:hypothetical protein